MKFFTYFISLLLTISMAANSIGKSTPKEYVVYEKQGKKGLKDSEGEVVIPAQYDAIGWSQGSFKTVNGVVGYKSKGLWGLLDIDSKKTTIAKYKQLYNDGSQYIIASQRKANSYSELFGVITPKDQIKIPFEYSDIKQVGERVIVGKFVNRNLSYGLINLSGKEIIPIIYKEIKPLGELRFSVKYENSKTALFDEGGQLIQNVLLDSISKFKGNYALIFEGNNRGLINRQGETVIPLAYQHLVISEDGIIKGPIDYWDVLTAKDSLMTTIEVDSLNVFSDKYLKASVNGQSWLMERNGKVITSKKFDYIGKLNGNLALFETGNKIGVINQFGQEKIPANFDSIVIDNDILIVKKKGIWSLYDSFNVKKTSAAYQYIGKRSERLYPVVKNGYWGFIDRNGNEIIDCVYENIGRFNNDLVEAKFHGEYGIIDKLGEWVILPSQLDSIKVLSDKYYLTYKNGLKKLITLEGELVYFTENDLEIKDQYLLEYISNGGIWKIDFSGQIIKDQSNGSYEEIRNPSENFYAIKKDGRYGFIDEQNRLRVANRYDAVGDFHEGMAAFQLLGQWGFIDKSESIIVQPIYETVSDYRKGVAVAYKSDGVGLIDIKGNEISSFSFDSLIRQPNNRYLVKKNGKSGLLSSEGRLMINAKYEYLRDLNNGYFIISKNDKFGLVDIDGVNTIPLSYDQLKYDKSHNIYFGMKKSPVEKVELR